MAVVYGVTFLILATVPCGIGFIAGYAAGRENVLHTRYSDGGLMLPTKPTEDVS